MTRSGVRFELFAFFDVSFVSDCKQTVNTCKLVNICRDFITSKRPVILLFPYEYVKSFLPKVSISTFFVLFSGRFLKMTVFP